MIYIIDHEQAKDPSLLPPKEIVLRLSMFETPSTSDVLAILMWASQYKNSVLVLNNNKKKSKFDKRSWWQRSWWHRFFVDYIIIISRIIGAIKDEQLEDFPVSLTNFTKFRWLSNSLSSAIPIIYTDNDAVFNKLSELKVERVTRHTLCVEGVSGIGKTKALRSLQVCRSRRNTHAEERECLDWDVFELKECSDKDRIAYLFAVYECMDEGYVQEHSPITAWMYDFVKKEDSVPFGDISLNLDDISKRHNKKYKIQVPWQMVVFQAPELIKKEEDRRLNTEFTLLAQYLKKYLVDVDYLPGTEMFQRYIYDFLNRNGKFITGHEKLPHHQYLEDLYNLSQELCEPARKSKRIN